MPLDRDFKKYHESIAAELRSLKDRVRDLIGDGHWQSDGEHKEAVLRKVVRNHVAQSLHIGRGFVCGIEETSDQLDIVITQQSKPKLFLDGEMLLVTPDAVAAIIEVKTAFHGDSSAILQKLADNIALVRRANNPTAKAGLFVYDEDSGPQAHRPLLRELQVASNGEPNCVINWIAAGPDQFIRHWARGEDVDSPIAGPVWHSYKLRRLAHAYFVNNVVWDTCPNLDRKMQYAWFPVEGGKERHRQLYIGMDDKQPQRFNG